MQRSSLQLRTTRKAKTSFGELKRKNFEKLGKLQQDITVRNVLYYQKLEKYQTPKRC